MYTSRLTWTLILLAFLIALFLFFYVYSEGGLEIEKSLKVDVKITGLARGLIALDYPSKIEIRIKGPSRRVWAVTPDDIKVFIDLRNKKAGEYMVNIDSSLPPRIRLLEMSQDKFLVNIEKIVYRDFEVEVKFIGKPVDGIYLYPPIIRPSTIEIRGPESSVSEAYNVIVEANVDLLSQDFSDSLIPKILNTHGDEILNLESIPEKIHVLIPAKLEAISKGVPIIPNLKGRPASYFYISLVETEPKVIFIKGLPEKLRELNSVTTEPIFIDGLSENSTIEAKLKKIEGIEYIHGGTIRVTIKVNQLTYKQFSNIKISNDENVFIQPDSVELMVLGREEEIKNLKQKDIRVTLSSPILNLGKESRDLVVELPEGVYLVWLNPTKVNVRRESL